MEKYTRYTCKQEINYMDWKENREFPEIETIPSPSPQ